MVLSPDKFSLGWLGSLKPLVLDAASGHLGPLSSFCFYFTVFFLYVLSSSRDSGLFFVSLGFSVPLDLSTGCLLSLFMGLKPYVPRLFGSSSAFVDSPSATALGVPCSASSSVLREWPHVLL